jgi:hypothetical protein
LGTGGSREGAGRPGWRRKCEQLLWLDIRKLDRAKRLQPGQYFTWKWSRGDEPAGLIGIRTDIDHVRLIYTWSPYSGDPRSFDYPVQVERTLCHYGGSRSWWLCPRCHSRRAVIYGIARDGRFGCRGCMRLGYCTEAQDTIGRLWRKQRKLEAKLGENYQRPKGMHARTYERIFAKIDEVEERKDTAFYLSALAFLGRRGITPDGL